MTDATGMLVAQRYRLARVIGAGGMGRVWLGQDELIGREVAIKELLLPAGLDAEQRAMLCHRAMREAQLAGRLNHPGIVTVHDVVEFNGTPMIVMEFVRGGSLSDAIKARGGLPVDEVARIGTAVLNALRVAHEAGIVHRDLKPANVLLSGERVVITDFGIARLTGDVQLTTSGSIVGTPSYMAPEQGTGAPITPATDLWSLGATLYAAVEGRPPFEGPDFMSTLSALLTRDPAPPQRAGRLTPLLQALLRKNPAERATAEQAAHLLAGTGTPLPAKQGVPRRTLLFAGGGALAAIGISAAAWVLWPNGSGEAAGPNRNDDNAAAKGGAAEQSNTSTPAEPGKPVEITEHIQLIGHNEEVTSIAFSPDGKLLASGDGERNDGPVVRLWDAATGKQITTLVGPHGTGGASANAVAFSPDGKLLAAGGNRLGDSTMLWNVADRQLVGPLDESRSIMKCLVFSPDGKIVAGVTHTGGIKIWDVASRKVKIGLPDGDGGRNVVFSPDGKLLANGGTKGTEVRLSDPATGKTISTITDATGSDVSFSPDSRTLAVPDADGKNSMQLWDVATGKSKAVFDRTEDITLASVLFSPDGKTVAAWGLGNVIQLWDIATKQVRAVLIGAAGNVNTVVFDAKGTRLAAGGDDKAIRIWKL
ncbi:serine/threonine-protein kinase [Lentzea sp. NBRC 105346]|uniref:WD40 repeat domain-containing serine/threonine protein kinase n=1 Tax=Lentzea sp. NBRC 105346 TaxID=3032205 RepID=UPI002553CB91|nr:serine/threonine-protein kinase [Lentzea sp. NBRC 105346]